MLLIMAQESLYNIIDFKKVFDSVPHINMMKSYLVMEYGATC